MSSAGERKGRNDSPSHDFLPIPANGVVLNSRAVVADVLWQAAVKITVRLQLHNQFPGRKGKKIDSQSRKENIRLMALNQWRQSTWPNTTRGQQGTNRPQSISLVCDLKQHRASFSDDIRSRSVLFRAELSRWRGGSRASAHCSSRVTWPRQVPPSSGT